MESLLSERPVYKTGRNSRLVRVLLHGLAGAAIGYLVLHPLSMLIHYSCYHPEYGELDFLTNSFVFEHVHMAAYFAALGALAGMVQGMYTHRLKELYEKARALSLTDELTLLYNRRHFLEELGKELQRARRYGKPLCLMIIDADNFKRYNDTHGHQAGDKLLKDFAELISTSVRATDIAGRYGGDEFVVVMPGTVKATAFPIAERLRKGLLSRLALKDRSQNDGEVTLSIGIAEFPSDSTDLQHLIKEADMALYKAKELGRNRICQANGYPMELDNSSCEAEAG